MAKMENESNLQVTFSKRRSGLFKKASELNTLCGADIAIVVFSPGGKVYSLGHPSVEIVVNRFLNFNQPPPNQNNNMRLNEVCPNNNIWKMNDILTDVMNQLELAKKKNEELRKIRKNAKIPENWWEEPVEELDLDHAKEFKGKLEALKKIVTDEASKYFQICPLPNYYVGSSSGAPFRDGGYINSNLDTIEQIRMLNANAYFNRNMYLPNYTFPYENNNYTRGFVPEHNLKYMHVPMQHMHNQYHNQNLSFKEEDISENERHQDGHPPHL